MWHCHNLAHRGGHDVVIDSEPLHDRDHLVTEVDAEVDAAVDEEQRLRGSLAGHHNRVATVATPADFVPTDGASNNRSDPSHTNPTARPSIRLLQASAIPTGSGSTVATGPGVAVAATVGVGTTLVAVAST